MKRVDFGVQNNLSKQTPVHHLKHQITCANELNNPDEGSDGKDIELM